MRLFRVTLYDKVREGKRAVHFSSYLVTADNADQALRILREERPGAFLHIHGSCLKEERQNGTVWLTHTGVLPSKYAERVYKLADFMLERSAR